MTRPVCRPLDSQRITDPDHAGASQFVVPDLEGKVRTQASTADGRRWGQLARPPSAPTLGRPSQEDRAVFDSRYQQGPSPSGEGPRNSVVDVQDETASSGGDVREEAARGGGEHPGFIVRWVAAVVDMGQPPAPVWNLLGRLTVLTQRRQITEIVRFLKRLVARRELTCRSAAFGCGGSIPSLPTSFISNDGPQGPSLRFQGCEE